jgi:hypothetical protein
MVLDRGVNSGEIPQGFDAPKLCHRSLLSLERRVEILASIFEPPTADLRPSIADDLHR